MKQCLALAVVACLAATGCSSTGFWRGGAPGHVTTSQTASRPTITRGFGKGGPELGVQLAAFNDSCDASCGACDVSCPPGCGDPCDPYGCNSGCKGLIGRLANGGCGPGGGGLCGGCNGSGCGMCGGCGLCPNGQTYPEYPTFNQGPPVGQVAYPYYTTRGPRDFLRNNPPTIGPY
jgi:hypothetical protein